MDIDAPPAPLPLPDAHEGHAHLTLPPFSASFPLPFRVLFLIGLAQLLWATNLHILHILGLDPSWILDFRDTPLLESSSLLPDAESLELDPLRPPTSLLPPSVDAQPDTPKRSRSPESSSPRPESGRLYQPVYKLFALYSLWVGGGWGAFRLLTGGEADQMEKWRPLIGLIALGVVLGIGVPWRGIGERERRGLRRAIKRIILPSLNSPIFFADVILADILTSFAKVLGDLWISACQIWNGGITQGRVSQTGWSNWITLTMVCLPYLLRFRQCLLEWHQSSFTSTRHIANAAKYFSAFPVILLSAAQKSVIYEIAQAKGITVQELGNTGERWFGEHRLFRLWLLAVILNSMFSFWWDVEMDWGLALCEVDTWLGPKTDGETGHPMTPGGTRRKDLSLIGRLKRLLRFSPSVSHARSPQPPHTSQLSSSHSHARSSTSPFNPSHAPSSSVHWRRGSISGHFFAFGLRHTLLLPDPLVYHLFTAIDLVLRFTWSLKLSSHLHTISEIESGVFIMEALELVRRWMWVFVRVEWEAVKMGEAQRFRRSEATGQAQVVWAQEDGVKEGHV